MRADAADWALAGLTLVEHSVDDNRINRESVLGAFDATELVVGLVVLASSLRASLAAAWGISHAELDEKVRAMLLHASATDFGRAIP